MMMENCARKYWRQARELQPTCNSPDVVGHCGCGAATLANSLLLLLLLQLLMDSSPGR